MESFDEFNFTEDDCSFMENLENESISNSQIHPCNMNNLNECVISHHDESDTPPITDVAINLLIDHYMKKLHHKAVILFLSLM